MAPIPNPDQNWYCSYRLGFHLWDYGSGSTDGWVIWENVPGSVKVSMLIFIGLSLRGVENRVRGRKMIYFGGGNVSGRVKCDFFIIMYEISL